MRKVGLLLGSFDPIHVGHINMAACILNSGLCDKILFVVAYHNPWKKNAPADFDLRCKMIEASVKCFDGKCEVCDFEKEIEPPTYSYKVLNLIRERYPEDELYLITGTDTFNCLPGWKRFKEDIQPNFKYIVIGRYTETGQDGPKSDEAFTVGSFGCIIGQIPEIVTPSFGRTSSTIVRNLVRNGMNPIPYVTSEVYEIIKDNKLYQNG